MRELPPLAVAATPYANCAEIIPGTQDERAEAGATPALFAGFLLTAGLDTLPGD